MAPPKSKVPIYPRPVSPLRAESFHVESRDVIYPSSSSSCSDDGIGDGDARAAKRRRIEKLGEQYLRGEGLQIVSAGLKGPFGKGWKNPWAAIRASRRPPAKLQKLEIPETVSKSIKDGLQAQKSNNTVQLENDEKVGNWLRKNNDDDDDHAALEPTEQISPTPAPLRPASVHASLRPNRIVQNTGIEVPTDLPPQNSSLQGDAQAETLTVLDQLPKDGPIERRAWVSHSANEGRAEFALLESRRTAFLVASPTTLTSLCDYKRVSEAARKPSNIKKYTNPSTEEPEMMRPPRRTRSNLVQSEAIGEVYQGFQHPKERCGTKIVQQKNKEAIPAVTASISVTVPAISTDTSNTSIINLPSAQPQSLLVQVPSTEIETLNDAVIDEAANETESPNQQKRTVQIENSSVSTSRRQNSRRNSATISVSDRTSNVEKVNIDAKQNQTLIDIAREGLNMHTQERLAGMAPLEFSTIKKPNKMMNLGETPITATKSRADVNAKREKVTPGERVSSASSQGSLKVSFRVSKMTPAALGKENKSVTLTEDENNIYLSQGLGDGQNDSQRLLSSPKRLKSALKPLGPSSSEVPQSSTKYSHSTGIDGGQQGLLMDDDNFNLAEAIDDLGSYLGTWDADKEASVLAREV